MTVSFSVENQSQTLCSSQLIPCRLIHTPPPPHTHTHSQGSPLVVSLIGALLREFPDRWVYYLRQLQQKQFKRIRKSSSYDYDALDQAMAASIQVLPEEHSTLYKDLTVLEKDVKVPAKVSSGPGKEQVVSGLASKRIGLGAVSVEARRLG